MSECPWFVLAFGEPVHYWRGQVKAGQMGIVHDWSPDPTRAVHFGFREGAEIEAQAWIERGVPCRVVELPEATA